MTARGSDITSGYTPDSQVGVCIRNSRTMAGLDVFLASKGVTKEELNKAINLEQRNEIAIKIGKDWETLATCIGIAPQEVFDLKETYPNSPKDQRLGMMNRWEELYGSEATYLKLIEGLEQIGRRSLTEFLLKMKLESRVSPSVKEDRQPRRISRGKKTLS